jgi:hypothetical protein
MASSRGSIHIRSDNALSALAPNVTHLPIWSFQGDKDFPPFLNSNRDMIAAIRKAGGSPRYTEYPGMGHEIWDRVFKEPGLVAWLFAQSQVKPLPKTSESGARLFRKNKDESIR